jgi:L-rhamnose mutarotase
LFTYCEYHCEDWAADQEWCAIHDLMQAPLATRKAGEWWAMAEEVFHHD